MFKTIFSFDPESVKNVHECDKFEPCIVFMGEDQCVCMGENVTLWQFIFAVCKKSCTNNHSRIEKACLPENGQR